MFLGIDIGASHLKIVVIHENGSCIKRIETPITTYAPQIGWTEQNPYEWCDILSHTLYKLFHQTSIHATDITAISITAGTHIVVLCDKNHTVLRPAILWSDQRAYSILPELQEDASKICTTTLHQPNATWTLGHLKWLSLYESEIIKKTAFLLPAKDWLRKQLTGETITDLSDAIGTQLFDIHSQEWSPDMCHIAGISPHILPTISHSMAQAGTITSQAAYQFHLAAGTTVYVGTIDTTAELISAGVAHRGDACIKLASSGVVSICSDTAESIPPISCYPQVNTYDTQQNWYFASGMNNCTTAYHWVRHTMLGDISYHDMESLASSAPIGSNGVLFHPYLRGERAPHWNAHLTACFSGMTHKTEKKEIARATYEGIALALYDVSLDIQKRTNMPLDTFTLIGGGSHSLLWRQMIADMHNLPIRIVAQSDAAYGVALLAAIASKAFPDIQTAINQIEVIHNYTANQTHHNLYNALFHKYDTLRQRLMA